ncbi:MAG: penicillin acylase family protein [Bacteroidales bacterium]|jgi:penicillin amidase|nr:penicillin acylase family protein [Bacteroidales bacterium]
MKLLKKILLSLLLILIVVAIGAYIFVNHLSTKAIPDYNQTVELRGLTDEVQVFRDSLAVPHIYAKNETDLYRTVGFVMAQDRMWQMDLLRRVTQGRLSEIFGSDLINTDLFLRALRIPEKSEMMLADITIEQSAALNAYADGVNQYIEQYADKLPPEFSILGYKPEPWEPGNSLNVTGYMAWDLAGSAYSAEITLYKIIQSIGMEKAEGLVPNISERGVVVYPDFKIEPALLELKNSLMAEAETIEKLGVQVFNGSNNWAVSGDKSVNGMPIMANDMHLGLNAPGIWYQIHEVIEGEHNATGLAVPGQPFVVAGHNENIAWGMTNLYVDDIDLYLETINPEDSSQYFFMGEWKPMEIRKELIRIKGGDSVYKENKFTHRGPIVSGFKKMDQAISMRWIGNDYSNEMRAVYMLNKAANWDEFKDAIRTFNSVSQNFVYADAAGNIGLYAGGGIPIRKGKNYLIKPGETDEFDWTDRIPFEELPHSFNPENNMVSSANNKTVGNDYPYYIGTYFSQNYRISRIREMLEEKEKLSVEDFKRMQADQNSMLARKFVPDIIIELLSEEGDDRFKKAYDLLFNWDGTMDANAVAPLLFEKTYLNLIKNILNDDLGNDLFTEYFNNSALSRNFIDDFWKTKDPLLCDDISTPDIEENFGDQVRKSFKETLSQLSDELGSNMDKWTWGSVHQVEFNHQMGGVAVLDKVFGLNRGPYPIGGSFHTVSPYTYAMESPFTANHGASHRHIFVPNNWDESLTIIPTGESGIPASDYYMDQTEKYLNNEYHADPFTRKAVEKQTRYAAKFIPKR